MSQSKRIILASSSPRRQELLKEAGVSFDVQPADIDENQFEEESPEILVSKIARAKAAKVANQYTNQMVLAADTLVAMVDENGHSTAVGKPQDAEEAKEILTKLQGTEHRVLSSCCFIDKERGYERNIIIETSVAMKELSEDEINAYVSTGLSLDKAGAYGIQDVGGLLVSEIDGSYSNVVGIPVAEVVEVLKEQGYWDADGMSS